MTEQEKCELINTAESIEDLQEAVKLIAERGYVQGKKSPKKVLDQVQLIPLVVKNHSNPAYLTRSYGIRQQAMYLKYYYEIEKISI